MHHLRTLIRLSTLLAVALATVALTAGPASAGIEWSTVVAQVSTGEDVDAARQLGRWLGRLLVLGLLVGIPVAMVKRQRRRHEP